ncbi:MAG: transcriptional regulator [Spirochaetaceae bacterium]
MKRNETETTDSRPEQAGFQRRFTDEDRRILAAMESVVTGLAHFLGPYCEVLLHSLENLAQSVIHIENGHVTGRSVGSPVTDLALRILHSTENGEDRREEQDFRIYTSSTADGRPLRSVTMVIRNNDYPIGMLCLNFDLSMPIQEVSKFVSAFTGADLDGDRDESPEHYMMSAEDLVTRSLDVAIEKSANHRGVSPQAKNRMIVSELYSQGIFDIKGAVDMVSNELGVSRFTVYNYIRDLRNEREDEQDA